MGGPEVTVVLPTHNGAARLPESIQSVLSQSCRDLECLIVEDGSTDQTAEYTEELAERDGRVRVIHTGGPVGLQKALNLGLRQARGELVARIDDDDVWVNPEKLRLQVDAFRENRDLQVLGTGSQMMDPINRRTYVRRLIEGDAEVRNVILSWNPFVHSSVVFRRESALRFGGYDEEMRHCEDHDLWMKLGSLGMLQNRPEVCVRYRLSETVTAFHQRMRECYEEILLIRRHGSRYPGRGRALISAMLRFLLHLLPVSHGIRSALRGYRGR